MIKKKIGRHDFRNGGVKRWLFDIETDFSDIRIQPANFDYASLYPTQTIHHIVPDTHITDYNTILGVGRSRLMENFTERLRELREEHGWRVTFDNETNNPIDGYTTNPCGEIPLDYETI
jgi:hypothetical protein